MGKPLLIVLSVFLLLLNFTNRDLNSTPYYTPPYNNMEKYNPAMGHINNLDKMEQFVDASAQQKGIKLGSIDYLVAMEDAIEKRFYHGFSHLTTGENWIAAFGEKLFGFGLSCKVLPNDIMEHGNAACSQQSMVMMELLKRKNLSYRKVGFPHHFALEVMVDGAWYYFDPNMEPTMTAEQRNVAHWKHAADNLKQYYDPKRFHDLDYKFGVNYTVTIGGINEKQAANAKMFQSVTGWLSKILWLAPLLILALAYKRKSRIAGTSANAGWISHLRALIRSASTRYKLSIFRA
jgi:hypothetical protein